MRDEICDMRDVDVEDSAPTTTTSSEKHLKGTYIPSADLAEWMTNDLEWLAKVSENTKAPIEALRKELREFCSTIAMTEDVKELTDARRHFIAWRRKRPQQGSRPTDGGRPYRLMTYAEMVAQAQREGKNTDGYVAIRVRGKEKPMWVTKADKELYQIPDEL